MTAAVKNLALINVAAAPVRPPVLNRPCPTCVAAAPVCALKFSTRGTTPLPSPALAAASVARQSSTTADLPEPLTPVSIVE